jgi:hypothetical protein
LRSFARLHPLDEATRARRARHPVRAAALPPALAIALQLGVDDSYDARGWPKSVEQALAVGLPSAAARTLSLR